MITLTGRRGAPHLAATPSDPGLMVEEGAQRLSRPPQAPAGPAGPAAPLVQHVAGRWIIHGNGPGHPALACARSRVTSDAFACSERTYVDYAQPRAGARTPRFS